MSTISVPAFSKTKLIIFHAGSLSVPLETMEKDFEAKYPDIEILRESGGSTKMARMISELHKPADIMLSADYTIIDEILKPKYANWNVKFATNQMVLTYTAKSKYANEINTSNWFETLLKKDVIWGQSDPNLDPCGYRALMTMQLAEKFYKKPGLYKKLIENRPISGIRPKAVELISLLETGNMDYAWEYLSVAIQHKLKYIKLDDHINLRNFKYNDYYKQAMVKVVGKRPGLYKIKTGKSCTYGATILKNSEHNTAALKFFDYLLNPKYGLKIMKDAGQVPIIPCKLSNDDSKNIINKNLLKYIK